MTALIRYWQVVFIIVWKDLAAEWRTRTNIAGMLIFSILVILIFSFALELETQTTPAINSGIVWVTLIFSGSLGLNHVMPAEKDRACLDGLLLAPIDRSVIFLGKVISTWLLMLVVALFLLPLYSVLFNTTLFSGGVIFVILLGTVGYALCGTLLSALSMQSHTREMLLPVLLFPVVFPLLLAVVKSSSGYLQGLPAGDIQPWLNLLFVFDAVFLGLGLIFFDLIMEE